MEYSASRIDLDDYTQDPIKVAKKLECGPKSAWRIQEEFEIFYDANPDLLAAHEKAAAILNENGVTVSAAFLTQFVRWFSKMPYLLPKVMDCYRGVVVEKAKALGNDFKIANNTTAPLGRYLRKKGYRVRVSKSKVDELDGDDE